MTSTDDTSPAPTPVGTLASISLDCPDAAALADFYGPLLGLKRVFERPDASLIATTDGAIFVCVEGHGSTKVGDKVLEWGPNDVFTVPSWHRYAHDVKDEAVLFSISDKPAQEALGIWREKH